MKAKKPIKRYIIASDKHAFVGRLMDLSIIWTHFDSYDEGAKYPDVKYTFDVVGKVNPLLDRVESLNHIGDLLWPKKKTRIEDLPLSAFDYCNLIHDAFLMRFVSVLDCCCNFACATLELNIKPREINTQTIRRQSKSHPCCDELDRISEIQLDLRKERNFRVHQGVQYPLTDDDTTFRSASIIARWGRGVTGEDRYGRKLSLPRFYAQATRTLRTKFTKGSKDLSSALNGFYCSLHEDFEQRWINKRKSFGAYKDK